MMCSAISNDNWTNTAHAGTRMHVGVFKLKLVRIILVDTGTGMSHTLVKTVRLRF